MGHHFIIIVLLVKLTTIGSTNRAESRREKKYTVWKLKGPIKWILQ